MLFHTDPRFGRLEKPLKREYVSGRFAVLDELRGILALIVVLGHLSMPPLFGSIDQSDPVWRNLARLFRTVAFGPPAVIAFFVISGFCIHYAFADVGKEMPVFRFYLRRYLRIGVPIVVAVGLLTCFQPDVALLGEKSVLWRSTLWSVLVEEIYYAIYPMLLLFRRRFGMHALLLITTALSAGVIVWTFPASDWSQLGVIGTAVVLLPVWLLGAALAEQARTVGLRASVSGLTIGFWRVGAWVVMWLSLVLHFHGGLHETFTGPIVGIFAFLWLRAELSHSVGRAPSPFLVWFGAWSYSLYLVHPLVISIAARYGFNNPPSVSDWSLTMVAILGVSYAFFLLIEAPSHALARRISLGT